jgi:photosystem II stability/assembly factor-like uncharacterized protein
VNRTQASGARSSSVPRKRRLSALAVVLAIGLGDYSGAALQEPQTSDRIPQRALDQIQALIREKESRTPVQRRLDSQLIYRLKAMRGQSMAEGVTSLTTDVPQDGGRLVIDVTARVTDVLLQRLGALGVEIVEVDRGNRSLRLKADLDQLETIAGFPQVVFIQPKQEAITSRLPGTALGRFSASDRAARRRHVGEALGRALEAAYASRVVETQEALASGTGQGSKTSEGDQTHRAAAARGTFNVNGAGVKIGVLSDGVTSLAASKALGDLGDVTVLPGQAGSGDEGTAMLEIIHDLAPGAQLYFATAFSGITSFAQNIRNLRAAGCDIIVDDVFYYVETPFQDGQATTVGSNTNAGVVIQAVKDVTAAGAMYFSSAGNSGNLTFGTSGTWEGDFVDGGATASPLPAGRIHSFGSQTYNALTASSGPINLSWSDPLGASANDYDLFRLSAAGTVLASSTNVQSGTQDPYEQVSAGASGDRLVIVKSSAGAGRFLHLDTNRGRLAIATTGQTHGHAASSAANSFGVAATPAVGPYPNPFSSSNHIETFSSDGPRRVFYRDDGAPITPGNVSSSGGQVLNKPDITAADGTSVTGVGGFSNPFFGTSAAAPHAAAIAALIKSSNPGLTPAQIRAAMTTTAIDIEATGLDRDSGAGIVMAFEALQTAGATGSAFLAAGVVTATENPGNGNGAINAAEGARLFVTLNNLGLEAATLISATLTTSTPGVTLTQPAQSTYPDVIAGASGTNTTPFLFTLSSDAPCALTVDFTLTLTYTGGASPSAVQFQVPTGPSPFTITSTLDSVAPTPASSVTTSTGVQTGRLFRDAVVSVCGTQKAGSIFTSTGSRQFDAFSFTTCPESVSSCADVEISTSAANTPMFSAAYAPAFNPASLLQNYKGDPGLSTSGNGAVSRYAFSVGGGAQTFAVAVSEVDPGGALGGQYTLKVSGACVGQCGTPNQVPVARARNVVVVADAGGTASASIDDGSADGDGDSLTITQSPPGPYAIGTTSVLLTVTDPKGAASQATATVLVVPFGTVFDTTTTTLSSSANPSTFGQSAVLTASVTASGGTPSGSVMFKEGPVLLGLGSLNSGNATFSTAPLSVGSHVITAVYTGDGGFSESTSTDLTQTVNKASTVTALTSTANPSNLGQSLTLTATVTSSVGTPTGTVTFADGATSLGVGTLNGGVAALVTTSLASGSHSLTATYSGSASFAASVSAPLIQSVRVWTSGGPLGSGVVRTFAIDPSTPSTMYAGTDLAGVFKSVDSGGTWVASNTGGLAERTVRGLVINAATPSTVYAGTDSGVFKSMDAGGTWAAVNSGLTNTFVQALVLDPTTPSTLYAGTSSGVFKSTNSGGSWSAASTGLTNTNVQTLAVDPTTPSILYAAMVSGQVFKSIDSGGSWTASLPAGGIANALAIHPTTSSLLYAGTGSGVFKSVDSGVTWASVLNEGATALAINPANPSTVYAGTSAGVRKSTDSGATWVTVSTGLTRLWVYALAINPTATSTVFAGTNGGSGVFKSTDAGATWSAASSGMNMPMVNALAIHPSTQSTLYAGTQSGIFKSTDSGGTWMSASAGLPFVQFVRALIVHPTNPLTLYAGTVGFVKSVDAGATWVVTGTGLTNQTVNALAIDPASPTTLYAGTFGGVWKSIDGGSTFAATNAGLTSLVVQALAVNPTTSSTLYAGTTSGLFKSADSGASWTAANTGLGNTNVKALVINPTIPATLYAGTAGGVFRSTNSGATWTSANTGLTNTSINALAMNSTTPSTLYAGTDAGGVFVSTDSGATWTAINAGLPGLKIRALAFDPTGGSVLYSGLGAVWQLSAGQMAVDAGNNQTATVGSTLGIAPSVIVRDAGGNPMAGVAVTFAVASGSGSLTGGSQTTNASGIATVGSWTLGTVAGNHTLTATAVGLTGSPVTFTASATPGAASQIAVNAGNNQTATVGTAVTTPPSVVVRDSNNNPVSGVPVTFAVASGGGSATGLTATTNASGIATVGSWTLGTPVGTNTLTATSGVLTGSPVTFTATAIGIPTQTAVNGGNGQTATAGTAVSTNPSVIVRDASGNPVPGVSVSFAVALGGGNINGTIVAPTNTAGIATVGTWTLGTVAGTNMMTATAAGLGGSPVTFVATGTAGAATQLSATGVWTSSGPLGGYIQALAVDPTAPSIAYAASVVAGIFKSTDGGATWASSNFGVTNSTVQALFVDPLLPARLYAGTAAGLFRSSDAGATWVAINSGLTNTNVSAIVVDPSTAMLYVGTGNGVHKSTNQGATWTTSNNGLSSLGVESLVIDPLTPSTLYAGTILGGVFKSTNSGGTWTAANGGLTSINVLTLAVNPSTPTTLYAGTLSGGAFKSTDAGTTWAPAMNGYGTVHALAIDPASGSTIYAATTVGVVKSTNAGSTWAPITPVPYLTARALAINPSSPSNLYAGMVTGLLRSSNGGASWSAANVGLEAALVQAMAVHPTVPATVYSGTSIGVFKSTDSGGSWLAASTGLSTPDVRSLALNPTVPSTLYAGTISGIFKSTDSGTNWTKAPTVSGFVGAVAINPQSPLTVYAATQLSGVFKSTDGGATWSTSNAGLSNLDVRALAIDPQTPSTLYVGTSTGVVFKSTDSGGAWSASNTGLPATATAGLGIDPIAPSTLYVGTNGGIYKSTNAGATWTLANALSSPQVLALDSLTPSTLYAGTLSNGVFVSKDSGASWTAINTGLPALRIRALALDPSGTNLYAGLGAAWKLSNPRIGGSLTATVGSAVGTPPSVIVRDANGNPVSGVSVTFAVGAGGGSATGLTATTNALGVATVGSWTLGTTAGTNTLTAASSGLTGSPATFTAIGTPGAPTQITLNAGNGQTATAGAAVTTPPSVIVRDANNNPAPVSGILVTFAVASGGGSGTGLTATTNAYGAATVGSWTLGTTVGANTLTAASTGLTGSPVTFTATGVAGPATQVAINALGTQTATAGSAVATPPSVLVRDVNNNPVPGASVTFAVASGGGSVIGGTTTTNNSGVATVGSWTLGTTAGTNTLTATATGLLGSPITFTGTGIPGVATQIAVNAGNNQTANAGAAVATPPSVIVRDANGNPVSGSGVVTFAVASGGGSATGLTPLTSAGGVYTVGSWTLGATAGSNTLTATATGLTGSPVTFTATGLGAPTVMTPTAASVTATTATLGGNVTGDGGLAITERGIVYSETASNGNPQIGGSGVTKSTAVGTTGLFTVGVTVLLPATGYSYKAFATNSLGTSYTTGATFTTSAAVPGPPTIGAATAGSGSVSVTFTAPANDGGSAIAGYTATCGTKSSSGAASPITVTGLTNGIGVTCTVIATNGVGNSLPSGVSNIVTPTPPAVQTVCASGCDFTRIQDAINASGSGGSVLVRSTYDSFAAGEAFPIRMSAFQSAAIEAHSPAGAVTAGTLTLTGETDANGTPITKIRTRGVTGLDGIVMVSGGVLSKLMIVPGDATGPDRVISASGDACPGSTCALKGGLTIQNVVIDFTVIDGSTTSHFNTATGLDLRADDVLIDKVTIKGIAGSSILVDGDNATIQNSTLDGRDGSAIRGLRAIGFGADQKQGGAACSGFPTNYVINANTLTGYADGILWCSGRNNTVSNNTITDIAGKAIDTSGSQGTQIFGNILQQKTTGATYGIGLSTNTFQTCTGNTVRNNKVLGRFAPIDNPGLRDMQRGVVVQSCLETTIFQNELRDFVEDAISVSMQAGVPNKTTIQGNTLIGGNAAGIRYLGADSGATAVDQSVIRDNVVNEFRKNGIIVQFIKGVRTGAGAGNVVAYNSVRAVNLGKFADTHAFNLQNLENTAFDRNTALDTRGALNATGYGFFLANSTGVNGNCNTGATNDGGLFAQVNVTPVYGNANVNCRVALYSHYDFDGDGKSDIAMYRHTTGEWLIRNSSTGSDSVIAFGAPGSDDIPAPGNYETPGKTNLAIYRFTTGEWFIRRADGGTTTLQFGAPLVGDVPMPADYDGDGITDLATFRVSTANAEWYIRKSSDLATQYVAWGCAACADLGVPGDYDGDGKADVAVYRRSTGNWFIRNSNDTTLDQVAFGSAAQGDLPVPGRYTQTSKTDLALYRSLTGDWLIRQSTDLAIRTESNVGSPAAGDFPVSADYTISGITDIAVYRPTPPTAMFRLWKSPGVFLDIPYGNPGAQDAPLTAR